MTLITDTRQFPGISNPADWAFVTALEFDVPSPPPGQVIVWPGYPPQGAMVSPTAVMVKVTFFPDQPRWHRAGWARGLVPSPVGPGQLEVFRQTLYLRRQQFLALPAIGQPIYLEIALPKYVTLFAQVEIWEYTGSDTNLFTQIAALQQQIEDLEDI